MSRRNLVVVCLAAVLSTALIAECVQAQERRRGRFGRGFGPGFGGDPTLRLLRVDKVLQEIKVSEDQKPQIEQILRESRGERPDVNFRELSREERRELFADLREQAEKRAAEAHKKLDKVLKSDQSKRLKQISIQVRGVHALADPEVAEALKLSEEQKEKIASTRRESAQALRSQIRELFRSGNRDEIREKITQMRKEADEIILALLTEAQKKQFESLKGEPFEIPQRAFGRRGGRGRGPDGRGRPERPERPERPSPN